MVRSWILGSLSKDLAETFVYCSIAQILWEELKERFGECEGCKCGLSKKLAERDALVQTIQFLMGLNKMFEGSKNQILIQDPLPNANKAYAMLQNVESQRSVSKNFEDVVKASVMLVKTQNSGKFMNNKANFKKKDFEKNEDPFCEHCKTQGHVKESCFKIIGYPYWYVDLLKTKKDKKNVKQVNMAEAKLDEEILVPNNQKDWMADLVQKEVAKALKAVKFGNECSNAVNFIHTDDSVGMAITSACKTLENFLWIVDTGASSHICINRDLFDELTS